MSLLVRCVSSLCVREFIFNQLVVLVVLYFTLLVSLALHLVLLKFISIYFSDGEVKHSEIFNPIVSEKRFITQSFLKRFMLWPSYGHKNVYTISLLLSVIDLKSVHWA